MCDLSPLPFHTADDYELQIGCADMLNESREDFELQRNLLLLESGLTFSDYPEQTNDHMAILESMKENISNQLPLYGVRKRSRKELTIEGVKIPKLVAEVKASNGTKVVEVDSICIHMMECTVGKNFNFKADNDVVGYRRAPPKIMRLFIVAFLLSRFGYMSNIKDVVVTKRLCQYFGIDDEEDCCGQTCEQIVQNMGLVWPAIAYESRVQPTRDFARDHAKNKCHQFNEKHCDIYIMKHAPATYNQQELMTNGFATPLLYNKCYFNSPLLKALAFQLLVKGCDTVLKDKGYEMGASPDEARVTHPLLNMQILILHPHITFLASVLVFIPKRGGKHNTPLDNKCTVKNKLMQFVGQLMGMQKMKLIETDHMMTLKQPGPTTQLFAHQKSLVLGKTNSSNYRQSGKNNIIGGYKFAPRKWYERNIFYGHGMRQTLGKGGKRVNMPITVG